MGSLIDMMRSLSGSMLLMLLNVVWQCGAIFLVAYAAIKLCRPRSPLTRHLVWLLALVGMAACPIIAATTQAGSLQLVQLPVAIDALPGAAPEPVRDPVSEHDAVESRGVDAAAHTDPHGMLSANAVPRPETAKTAKAVESAGLDRHHDGPFAGSESRLAAGHAEAAGAPADSASALRVGWPGLAVAVWAAGFLFLTVRFLVARLAVRRLVKRSVPAKDTWLLRAFASAKAMVDLRHNVALRISTELAVPVATGVFRPCVLFPKRLVEQLAGGDLQAIAVHELTHVKRLDPAVMVLERLVQAVLFFHPAVWLASRALSVAREELCDEAVVRATSKPVAYARCLTSLFEQVRVLSHCRVASVGIAHYRSKLFQRVETLLSGRMLLLRRLPRPFLVAVIGAACAALVLIGGTTFVRAEATDEAETETPAAEGETTADEDEDPAVVTATVKEASEPYRWVSRSPSGAAVKALALCVSSPDVLYAATPNGVFKSTDGAATWKPTAPRSDDGLRREANDVAVDCADPNVVYNASGHLHKSTDGGTSWNLVLVGGGGGSVVYVETDPKNASTLYVADRQRGIYKSTDGGETWQARNTGLTRFDFWQLEVDPHIPNTLYCITGDKAYFTRNGADTWRAVELPFAIRGLKGIRVGGDNNDLLYARREEDAYYYSEDGGESWEFFYSAKSDPKGEQTATIKELRKRFCFGLPGAEGYSRWYGEQVLVHPAKPDVVYRVEVAEGDVLKTEDFGEHWTSVTKGLAAFDARGIACDSETPGLVYVAGRRGMYKSSDGAGTWEQIDAEDWCGPPVVIHPLDPQVLLVGTGVDKVIISTDGGDSWRQVPETRNSKIEAFVFDPKNANTFYVLTRRAILKTTDRGRTWDSTRGSMAVSRWRTDWPATRQTNAEIIYQITDQYKRLRRSTDVGQTWKSIVSLPLERSVRLVQVHPVDPKIVTICEPVGRLHLSRDAGDTWRTVELPESHRNRSLASIGMHPTDPDLFYVGFADSGIILRTLDGGKTFEDLSNGLPAVDVAEIVVSPTDGAVYAGTEGAGVYRLETAKAASDENSDE